MTAPRTAAEAEAYLAQIDVEVATWPLPSDEAIERLRALLGYTTHPVTVRAAG